MANAYDFFLHGNSRHYWYIYLYLYESLIIIYVASLSGLDHQAGGVGPGERGMREWEGKGRGVMGMEVKII